MSIPSIVLAVPEECAIFDEKKKTLKLSEVPPARKDGKEVKFRDIAKVLDGQHRIEGIRQFDGETFEVPVTIIVNADIADQAFIFATVNLAQTKVNRSLVFDLLDYSKSRSPQRTCHDIAVALNANESSPFKGMIKRLGSATPGVFGETITQAAFVMSLLPMITKDEISDRDLLMRSKKLDRPTDEDMEKRPFRYLFIDENDSGIARNISEYFHAVAAIWPEDWNGRDKGNILPRTNGFRAFMKFLKDVYVKFREDSKSSVFDRDQYEAVLRAVNIGAGGFNTEEFPPGTSGEKQLLDQIRSDTRIGVD